MRTSFVSAFALCGLLMSSAAYAAGDIPQECTHPAPQQSESLKHNCELMFDAIKAEDMASAAAMRAEELAQKAGNKTKEAAHGLYEGALDAAQYLKQKVNEHAK